MGDKMSVVTRKELFSYSRWTFLDHGILVYFSIFLGQLLQVAWKNSVFLALFQLFARFYQFLIILNERN